VKRLRRKFSKQIEQELGGLVKHLKFIDEIGANFGLTRLYGRAAPGARVVEATPSYSGVHYTIVAALGWNGVKASWVLEGAMDAAAYEVYVEKVLAPTVRAGDIVLMDNLSAHKSETVRRLIEARGAASSSCRLTRPTSIRSSCAGRKSRPPCVRPRLARWTLCWRH